MATAIVTKKYRTNMAGQLIDSLISTNYYMFLGKSNPFTETNDGTGISDNNPPLPEDDITSEYYYWDDMVAAKKLNSTDVSYVVPRRDYIIGNSYDMYDHDIGANNLSSSGADSLWTSTFYFITSEYRVYKVLSNNGGIAVTASEPTSESSSPFQTADGYVLKYLFTLNSAEIDKFLDPYFMPVSTTANTAESAGQIDVVKINNSGTNYVPNKTYYVPIYGDGTGTSLSLSTTLTNSSTTVTVSDTSSLLVGMSVSGTGIQADTAIASITNSTTFELSKNATATSTESLLYQFDHAILKVEIGGSGGVVDFGLGSSQTQLYSKGSGYTFGTVQLSDYTKVYTDPNLQNNPLEAEFRASAGIDADIKVVIGPSGGHGSNLIEELGASFVTFSGKFQQNEANDFSTANDFRRVGIMVNPVGYGTDTLFTAVTARQTYAVLFSGTTGTGFETDEKIVQDSTGAVGRVVEWDSANKILYYVQEKYAEYGTLSNGHLIKFAGGNNIQGASSGTIGNVETSPAGPVNGLTFSSGYNNPEMEPDSGNVIYIENRRPISRASDQTEDMKITVEF